MRRALFPPILKTVQPSTRSACGNTSRNSAIERKFLPLINLYQWLSADLVFGCFCAKSLNSLYGPVRIVFLLFLLQYPKVWKPHDNYPSKEPATDNSYTRRLAFQKAFTSILCLIDPATVPDSVNNNLSNTPIKLRACL